MSYPAGRPPRVHDHTTVQIKIIDVGRIAPAGNPSGKWEREIDEVFTFSVRAVDQAGAVRRAIAALTGVELELQAEEGDKPA